MELKNIWPWIKDKAIWSWNNWLIVLFVFIGIILVIWIIVATTRSIFRTGAGN